MEQEQDIIEGNKLIAEFMGVNNFPENEQVYNVPKYGAMSYTDLKYHSSWDWQIPTWQKLFNECIGSTSLLQGMIKFRQEYEHGITMGNERYCFNILVEAIQWYNQNK